MVDVHAGQLEMLLTVRMVSPACSTAGAPLLRPGHDLVRIPGTTR